MHAEQIGRRWDKLELARCIALWQSVILVQYERQVVASKQLRCQCLDRAFIVKLQRRLYEQRFLYRWLWVCPPKPREIEFNQVSKDPPAFYVRPVNGIGADSNWPVSYMAGPDDKKWSATPQPPAIADRQHYQFRHARPVSAALTTGSTTHAALTVAHASASEQGVAPGVFEQQLEASDRLALANRAITSDYEYRRLFEKNRRELRDGPARSHLCGRNPDEVPIYSKDVGVLGNMVADAVCQKMGQRLDFTSETAASLATVAQVANATNRPRSAR
jgi:hypothetical protein